MLKLAANVNLKYVSYPLPDVPAVYKDYEAGVPALVVRAHRKETVPPT